VCMIDNEDKRRKALALFKLADVWGIGKQTLAKLNYLGIRTPLEFANKKESWVRSHFTKPGLQTWKELNGISCIDTSEVAQRQTICTSRSFGNLVMDYDALQASVASFAGSCANKLRGQHSLTSAVTVFVSSNRFREDLPQYSNGQTRILPMPTSDTIEITQAALAVLKEIYREGISYKKTGVILGDITDASYIQQNLFDEVKNRPERMQLMKRIDELNHRFGLRKIHLAVEGEEKQAWHAKSEFRSGNYLSDLKEILTIQI
jgi:umuC protein